jgi:hypothetical protein
MVMVRINAIEIMNVWKLGIDVAPNSLRDPQASAKVKQWKKKRVGAPNLATLLG